MQYRGLLEAADGRYVNVTGSATINLKMGGLDDECEVVMNDGRKTEMILGRRDLQEKTCVVDLQTNQMWTAPVASAIIPLNSEKMGEHRRMVTRSRHMKPKRSKRSTRFWKKNNKKHQVDVMMASRSIYNDDCANDDNLGLNREEEEETPAGGVNRSQQNLCLKSSFEFIMQAVEVVVPLSSPQQEAEQIFKKWAPKA